MLCFEILHISWLLHLNMQHLSKSNPFFLQPYKVLICLPIPKVSPCDFPSHSLFFFSSSAAGCTSAFFLFFFFSCLIKKGVESLKLKIYWPHPDRSSRESHDGEIPLLQHATHVTLLTHNTDKPTWTRTHTLSYLQDVRGGGQCAATSRWASQRFWSDRRPGRSSPQSRYLHTEIHCTAQLRENLSLWPGLLKTPCLIIAQKSFSETYLPVTQYILIKEIEEEIMKSILDTHLSSLKYFQKPPAFQNISKVTGMNHPTMSQKIRGKHPRNTGKIEISMALFSITNGMHRRVARKKPKRTSGAHLNSCHNLPQRP